MRSGQMILTRINHLCSFSCRGYTKIS